MLTGSSWLFSADRVPLLQSLQEVLRDQLTVLEQALPLHRRLCPPELLPLQQKLDSMSRTSWYALCLI